MLARRYPVPASPTPSGRTRNVRIAHLLAHRRAGDYEPGASGCVQRTVLSGYRVCCGRRSRRRGHSVGVARRKPFTADHRDAVLVLTFVGVAWRFIVALVRGDIGHARSTLGGARPSAMSALAASPRSGVVVASAVHPSRPGVSSARRAWLLAGLDSAVGRSTALGYPDSALSPDQRAKVLTGVPIRPTQADPQTVRGLTPGLLAALEWLKDHSSVDTVVRGQQPLDPPQQDRCPLLLLHCVRRTSGVHRGLRSDSIWHHHRTRHACRCQLCLSRAA